MLAKISLYKKRRSNTVNKKTSCEQQVKKRGFLVNVKGTVPFLKQALQHWVTCVIVLHSNASPPRLGPDLSWVRNFLVIKSNVWEDINFQATTMHNQYHRAEAVQNSSDLKQSSQTAGVNHLEDAVSSPLAFSPFSTRPVQGTQAPPMAPGPSGSTHHSSWGSVIRRFDAEKHELYHISEAVTFCRPSSPHPGISGH